MLSILKADSKVAARNIFSNLLFKSLQEHLKTNCFENSARAHLGGRPSRAIKISCIEESSRGNAAKK